MRLLLSREMRLLPSREMRLLPSRDRQEAVPKAANTFDFGRSRALLCSYSPSQGAVAKW